MGTRDVIEMADMADSASEARLNKGDVDSAKRMFLEMLATLEEIVMTFIPILDKLPELVRLLVPKETILNFLNIDLYKNKISRMNDDTMKFVIRDIKSIPSKQREKVLYLLKLLEEMLRMAEESKDYSPQLRNFTSLVFQSVKEQFPNIPSLMNEVKKTHRHQE